MPTVTVCARTGLALSPSHGQAVTRICEAKRGPMSPWDRPAELAKAGLWNRWDTPGRTIYAGTTPEAAYGEVLAQFRPGLNVEVSEYVHPLGDYQLERTPSVSLRSVLAVEWQERGFLLPGDIPQSWRDTHSRCDLRLPEEGWFIDVDHSETIAAIRRGFAAELRQLHLDELTLSEIASNHRQLTATIATWLRGQVIFDGSLPHGIRYLSKYGADWESWAVWLRAMDDGKPADSEPTTVKRCSAIARNDPDLDKVLQLYGLRCW